MSFPIKCYDCGHAFDTMRVTASLKCARCGSDDIDLDDRTASGGTGWGTPRPNPLDGWAVQTPGNYPGPNPYASTNNVGDNTTTCQACGGSGMDSRASGGGYNEIPCRNCHGTGQQATHTTSPGGVNDATNPAGPPVGGARFQAGRRSSDPFGSPDDHIRGTDPDYDNRNGEPRKADTRSPDVKYRTSDKFRQPHVNKPMPLTSAACPSCGASSTQLVRDDNNDAWWHCSNCGPLANIDRHPGINPYEPGTNFQPDRSFGTPQKKRRVGFRRKVEEPKPGKALKMVQATLQTNPGLTVGQALTLVRNALAKYPE